MSPGVKEYVLALKASKRLGGQVVYHKVLPAVAPQLSDPPESWPDKLTHVLRASGIEKLYRHQTEAIDIARSGQHVVVATPTASGKTLVYNLTYLDYFLANPDARALYLFPLKALAQDQLLNFNKTAAFLSGRKPSAVIYDGDTPGPQRKRIREHPPGVIMTNPEMLNLSFLPYHATWSAYFSGLQLVVVDEVHTYRGVMGSHMAQVFRRLRRICSYYGANPTYIFNSATVANPAELAEQLTGLPVKTILKSGHPQGKRHTVFIDPLEGPAQTSILLLKSALSRGLRTIVYTQSRKLTELIAIWAGSNAGEYADRISAYRAGFLPQERREIEAKLTSGELLAVISTSALELGIDIGDLDLCFLVGYPGTIVATLQRGGRVGRSGQESGMVMIAGEDALDQYFMRHPEDLFKREPEAAVINPNNPGIMAKHLVCAAAELPLKRQEPLMKDTFVAAAVDQLENEGQLLNSADGDTWFSKFKSPQRHIDLRGSGSRFQIVATQDDEHRGDIDGFRAFKETHPGAIYLHRGDTYMVDELDLETNTVRVSLAEVDYYTRVRAHKNTEIMEVWEEKPVWGTTVSVGRLKVTEQVSGYERWRIRTHKRIDRIPLDLPEQTFETEGLWFMIPPSVQHAAESAYLHFMGGIHAMEHAAIGMFPLLVMADRNDLGGISTPFHQQTNCAAVFIYDGVPGGAGLSRQAFSQAQSLLAVTLKAIQSCPCSNGCPSCVHSPKCGSGNRPIDKAAAIFVLESMQDSKAHQTKDGRPDQNISAMVGTDGNKEGGLRASPVESEVKKTIKPPREKTLRASGKSEKKIKGRSGGRLRRRRDARKRRHTVRKTEQTVPPLKPDKPLGIRYGVFDLETQRSAQEVGGWHRADLMKVSCGVVYDSGEDQYYEYLEDQVPELIEHLKALDCVIGFNSKRFDYKVLTGYTDFDFKRLPSLDILEEVHHHLGYRLSLDHLARVTLGAQKSADGLQALKWWKQKRMRELLDYCRQDVIITRDIFLYGRDNGYLLFNNKAGNTVRVPVNFGSS
jgi:DEAD/DEAH box helicase domain-containing protein